jgi:delta1-piperideine-2-carboxylate reductase
MIHDWHEQAEAVFAEARKQAGVRLPSNRRHAARQRSEKYGVGVPDSLFQELAGLSPAT